MTKETALESLGKPFKLIGFTGGIMSRFDTIRAVEPDGTIKGDFLEANCQDCRLKEEQPEHLKKKTACSCGDPACGNPVVTCT